MAQDWTNLDAQMLGEGIHFVQEDQAPEIGAAIVDWHEATAPSYPELETVARPALDETPTEQQ